MPADTVVVEKKDRTARVVLNNPETLNALGTEVLQALDAAFAALDPDPTVDVVIVSGAGRAFSVGADIEELAAKSPETALEFSLLGRRVFSRIEGLRQPVIAAVHGYALGGGLELALACDIRIASEGASFGLPEVGLGVVPGWGGTHRLSEIVGLAKAKELVFTGKRIDATEAEAIGLVNKVVPAARLMEEAEGLAATIVGQSAAAVQMAKRVMDGLASEPEALALCFSTPGQRERLDAFLERQRKREQRQKGDQW